MKHLACLLVTLSCTAATVGAQVTRKVIPAGTDKLEGLSNHRFPFTYSLSRFQQIIDGSALAQNAALINAAAWRRDALITSSLAGKMWNYQITMHTTPVTPLTMSSTFATNRGPNPPQTVFSGVVNIPTAPAAFPTPNPFSVLVPFSAPFAFIPANGHLLIEVVGNDPANLASNWSPDGESYTTAITGKSQAVSPGCTGAGPTSVTITANNANAVLGGNLQVTWTPNPVTLTPAIGFIGTSNSSFGGIPLPLDLASAGMPGCLLGTNIVDLQVSGSAPFSWPIPNDPALDQLTLFTQAAVVAPGANAGGLILSWVLQVRIAGPANPAPVFQSVFINGDLNALTGTMAVAGTYTGTVLQLDGTFN